jgi:hypothetical protein
MVSTGHEHGDVDIPGLVPFGVGFVVAGVLVFIVIALLFSYLAAHQPRPALRDYPLSGEQGNRLPPEPRLQTNPRQDLADFLAEEDRTLTTYGWIDKGAGVVRIPIDRAMKLAVERGLPARRERAAR